MCRSHVSTAEPCDLEERESAPNNPEIESDHWFNRGAGVLAEVYQQERAGEWPDGAALNPMPVQHLGCYTFEPIYWLRQHPGCDVALRSEYGDTRELAKEAH